MWQRLKRVLWGRWAGEDERMRALEREVRRLRLEIEGDARKRARADELFDALADIALPVAHLNTQAHLLEVEGKPVRAGDVMAVVKQVIHCLEDRGLSLEGRIGETVAFDPQRHSPLSAEQELEPGQPVILRFVGVVFEGTILARAGVEKA